MPYEPRPCPAFNMLAINEKERSAAHHVLGQLQMLQIYVTDFAMALELFEQATKELNELFASITADPARALASLALRKRKTLRPAAWTRIACRDGAFTIYHIAHVISALRGVTFKSCPETSKRLDLTSLKQANALFSRYFPNYRRIRHAIGHDAELRGTPENLQENAGANGIMISGEVSSDGTYTVTIGGTIFEYRMNASALAQLDEIYGAVLSAYAPLTGNDRQSPRLRSHR